MSQLIHYTHCPACHSGEIYPALSAKDHTVSQEVFEIWQCEDCSLRFTQDVPDESSIGPYYRSDAYVSHSDTQQGIVNRLYHQVRKHTLNTKRELIKKETGKNSGKILDMGAGTGAFAHAMQQAGWEVTALEPEAAARETAQHKYGIQLLPPEALNQLEAGSFDVITLWHVLEHVHDLHGYLEKFFRLLSPGGKLLIAVPNYTSYDAKKYGGCWAAYDVPRHLYHFSPKSMRLLAATKGFTKPAMHAMWFDSYYVAMLSEKYRNGSGNMPGAVWNGLLSNLGASRDVAKCSSVIYVFTKPLLD